jgi:membrane associated rhomboid family serine protease
MPETGSLMKTWVVRIIIINVVVYLVQMLLSSTAVGDTGLSLNHIAINYFGLRPDMVIHNHYLWQPITYMFLHASLIHILFNMYFLFALGTPVEQAWGGKRFLVFYFFTGIGSGIITFVVNYFLGYLSTPTIGASGAILGVIVAFGMLFPEVELYFLFVPVPIRAKYLVLIYGAMNLIPFVLESFSTGGQGGISFITHLGGILFGFLYFLIIRKRGITFKSKLIKARYTREFNRRNTEIEKVVDSNESRLTALLEKIKAGGPESITDDEYQFIRYIEIMKQDLDLTCREELYKPEDPDCKKCADVEACLLRQIKKYLK